jgi:RecQ-mediated genome instability protein 1
MALVHLNEVTAHLLSKGLNPKSAWVETFLAGQRPGLPAAPLKQTALFRLIGSDITSTCQPSPNTTLPSNVLDANIQDRKVVGPIAVQILDIEDIGRSRWSQVEEIESEERGETTRGREIIRVVPGDEDDGGVSDAVQSSGPHKLLLQDAKGTRIYGLEVKPTDQIGVGMAMGSKLILKNTTVARGVLLLDPQTVTVLGGKIEELQSRWKLGRKEALKNGARDQSGLG